ncbi:TPA: hypothetical protein QDB19_004107 [Burkholderia vietnamiensis]|nr:hypothetical protein [Burkholderia vietnamiensis]
MIDQDKMRALAKGLRAAGPLACREAADAIDLLLAEVEQSRIDQLEAQGAFEEMDRENNRLRAELEAAAADKREMHAILLAVAILFWESNGSWTSLRYEADRAIKAALAQRQGEGS